MVTLDQGAYRSAGGANLTSELWSLLWGAAASPEYRARLCAVEWACDLFDFSDVPARRLCVSLCDDKVTAVRSAASRGLHPPPRASSSFAGAADDGGAAAMAAASATSSGHPRFESFVLGAMRDEAVPPSLARGGEPAPASLQELPPAALARALDFALECYRAHGASEGDRGAVEEAVAVFLSVIESTLESAPSAADGQHGHAQMVLLHRSAAVALQKLAAGDVGAGEQPGSDDVDRQDTPAPVTAAAAVQQGGAAASAGSTAAPIPGVAASLACRGPWLQQWLGHEVSTEIREVFAETTGAAAEFMEPDSELVPLLRALGHKLKVTAITYTERERERELSALALQILLVGDAYVCVFARVCVCVFSYMHALEQKSGQVRSGQPWVFRVGGKAKRVGPHACTETVWASSRGASCSLLFPLCVLLIPPTMHPRLWL